MFCVVGDKIEWLPGNWEADRPVAYLSPLYISLYIILIAIKKIMIRFRQKVLFENN